MGSVAYFRSSLYKTGLNHWSPFETISLFRKVAIQAVKAMDWHGMVVGGRGMNQYESIVRFRRYLAQKYSKRVRAMYLTEEERVVVKKGAGLCREGGEEASAFAIVIRHLFKREKT